MLCLGATQTTECYGPKGHTNNIYIVSVYLMSIVPSGAAPPEQNELKVALTMFSKYGRDALCVARRGGSSASPARATLAKTVLQ